MQNINKTKNMSTLKEFKSLLLLVLIFGLTFASYSCKKKQNHNVNSSGNNTGNNNNNDDDCDKPLEIFEITFSGQDCEESSFGNTNQLKYKFMVDTNIVDQTVSYLMDWSCNKTKHMFLELNNTRKDSLHTLMWDWTESSSPGSTTYSAANRKGGENNEYSLSVNLVETGIGESYIRILNTAYTELGIENFYDPSGEYKLTFVFYEE